MLIRLKSPLSLWLRFHWTVKGGVPLPQASGGFPVYDCDAEYAGNRFDGYAILTRASSSFHSLDFEFVSAGRIWWIARKARSILGPGLSSKYNTMIAIM